MRTSFNRAVASASLMVFVTVLAAAVASAEEARCEEAVAALKQAGLLVVCQGEAPADLPCSEGMIADLPCDEIVEIISLTQDDSTNAVKAIPHLRGLTEPEEVMFELRSFDAGQAKNLAAHAETLALLKGVRVGISMDTPASDEEVCYLSKIPNLWSLAILSLNQLDITDDGLKCLMNNEQLRAVNLGNTRVTDAGLKHLVRLKNLRLLGLMANKITGEGLSSLRELPIEMLVLADTQVDDDGLSHLQGLRNLERLTLTDCPIEGPGLVHLKGRNGLKRLSLSGTRIDDEALAHLTQLQGLEELFLAKCDIGDGAIKHLKQLVGLKRLVIFDTEITKAGVRELREALPEVRIEH